MRYPNWEVVVDTASRVQTPGDLVLTILALGDVIESLETRIRVLETAARYAKEDD